ncbi:hypothetical protein DERF_012370 [Dermatophagoides farinae]|uniref:Uncharacterized protein n=1 Tax=Dermatophagoides farinae TaxID=6954 RepID=A0A922KX91_DERFA|nr:hypothetical protein DERF_012370 [Dermatophagoides farinae]
MKSESSAAVSAAAAAGAAATAPPPPDGTDANFSVPISPKNERQNVNFKIIAKIVINKPCAINSSIDLPFNSVTTLDNFSLSTSTPTLLNILVISSDDGSLLPPKTANK